MQNIDTKRRTKIVCTIGPSTASEDAIRALIMAGMNVARLNFSHGAHDDHERAYNRIRAIAAELGENVAIMMDLMGPKIRTGTLKDGEPVMLEQGAEFTITTRDVEGSAACVSTTYESLPYDVCPGDRILLADGVLEIHVERIEQSDVHCRVIRGGKLGENKGINLPGVSVTAKAVTEKDENDLQFGLGLGVDFVALSFVRSPDDIQHIKSIIAKSNNDANVVAKIERPEALEHFDEILELTDAVMVARGDLGVEISLEDVPQVQKELIEKCNNHGKPVITATQMLESMITNARPTRAEANDVANAIYDGTDAVMLSGETATGQFPIEAVRVMAEIARRADAAVLTRPRRQLFRRAEDAKIRMDHYADAIGQAVARMVQMLDVKKIVCFTQSGYTVTAMARYRPNVPIAAMALSEETARRCALIWGVQAIEGRHVEDTDTMLRTVESMVLDRQFARKGDTIIIVAGIPLGEGGHTNLLKLHRVGNDD